MLYRDTAAFLATVLIALAAGLPSARAGDTVHVVSPGTVFTSPLTESAMWGRIAAAALRWADHAPLPRAGFYDVTLPASRSEYNALAGFGLLVVTVLTQDRAELPVRRVYFRGSDGDIELSLLSSIQSEVPSEYEPIEAVLGRHRADMLFLFPLHLGRKRGELAIDFASNREGFVVGRFRCCL